MKRQSLHIAGRFLKVVPALLILVLGCFVESEGVQKALPLKPGETFTYEVQWSSIPVGEISFAVLPFRMFDGEEAYHFVMNIQTNSTIDFCYKIRDREDSYVDRDMTHTLLYQKRDVGTHPRDFKVTYDWEKMTATRVDFGDADDPIRIMPGTFDPVALFFLIRATDTEAGDVVEIPISNGKVSFVAKASITGREIITVGDKAYDTYVMIPDTENMGKALKRNDKIDLKIWVTADEKKVPVRLETQVGIGTFVFELVSATM